MLGVNPVIHRNIAEKRLGVRRARVITGALGSWKRSILQNRSSVKDRAIYEKMVLPGIHPDGEVNVASIREALDAFKATGEVKADLDLDKMIDLSFVRYAQEVLGRYQSHG